MNPDVFSSQSMENLLLLAALGAFCALLLARLHLPVVTGVLLAGALLGPKGLGVVRNTELVQVLSKVGVVMLMFTIGLELSPRQLQSHARVMALGGLGQVGLTVLATALGALAFDYHLGQAVFLGFVVALSSTAMNMSTRRCCSTWNSAIARPNCLRVLAYSMVSACC